ncbi:salicylate hydroxylase [Exophiala viscosa]|uniref:salicylate hydroxylase n=1 Tax=Exophiala viscosa TaxID=2486360 RepID=UPI00219C06FC|nr:salicylate hydroxylase [Exophiala viscosa]
MPDLNVGICGAGIGGLAAAIAIRKAGGQVTILEAAPELGEIGAGIQMTPNVARLLNKRGVDKVIGDDLVEFEELNMRRRDGTLVGYTKTIPNVRKNLGVPWWLVHRMHLHSGLAEVAQREGANIVIDSRVEKIDWTSSKQVNVTTAKGKIWTFDLLIGADGVRSVVRKSFMPQVTPKPPTGNCAYRAIVSYDQIRKDPVAKELAEKLTMEVWMSDKAYIISYPISHGTQFNMVLSHHRDHLVDDVEDIDMQEFRDTYKDFDPRIKRIVDIVPSARRWPLLVTGPLETWSIPEKNVVLMGDAAHSMVNHMAQGAATSMEDGAYLARTLAKVVEGKINLAQAIEIYEKGRMPKVYFKQQVSFLNGAIWHLPDGLLQEARDKAMSAELQGEKFMRSPNLYGDPETTMSVYGYDAEEDAEMAIRAYLDKHEPYDPKTGVTDRELKRFVGWWWPKDRMPLRASKL